MCRFCAQSETIKTDGRFRSSKCRSTAKERQRKYIKTCKYCQTFHLIPFATIQIKSLDQNENVKGANENVS